MELGVENRASSVFISIQRISSEFQLNRDEWEVGWKKEFKKLSGV
jgi:hypothetical protein